MSSAFIGKTIYTIRAKRTTNFEFWRPFSTLYSASLPYFCWLTNTMTFENKVSSRGSIWWSYYTFTAPSLLFGASYFTWTIGQFKVTRKKVISLMRSSWSWDCFISTWLSAKLWLCSVPITFTSLSIKTILSGSFEACSVY